jgi:hypothetical protein
MLEAATDQSSVEVTLRINSVKIAGPVLRVSSFSGNRGILFTDNVIIEGILHPRYFIMDADQMNFDTTFEMDKRKLKEYATHFTILKEFVKVKSVKLTGHSASGSVNWNAVSVSPPTVATDLRKVKGVLRDKVLDYFKNNREKLVSQLNGILPSVITFLR